MIIRNIMRYTLGLPILIILTLLLLLAYIIIFLLGNDVKGWDFFDDICNIWKPIGPAFSEVEL